MARGPKKHLKRLNAPSHWMLDKLGGVFVSSRHNALLSVYSVSWRYTSALQHRNLTLHVRALRSLSRFTS